VHPSFVRVNRRSFAALRIFDPSFLRLFDLCYCARVPDNSSPHLVRAIGRWSLTAMVVNGIIGSAVYGLPSEISGLLGRVSPWAYVIAAVGTGAVMACFAEVGSQFPEAGGPYVYAREVFGRFWGIQMGWLNWLVRLASAAANANIFVQYLGQFYPGAREGWERAAVLAALVGALAVVNVRGVKLGAEVNNALAAAKLVPLIVFIVAGLALVTGSAPAGATQVRAPGGAGAENWLGAILLLVFAYGGFETGLYSMSEARDTRHDAPFALFTALGTVFVVYTLVQVVVVRALPDASESHAPLAEASRLFVGPAAGAFMSVGALLSVYGNLSSSLLNGPRLTFALAERGDFPAIFGAVGRRFQTPYVSIVVYAVLVFALSLAGSFRWNAVLAAVARVFTYAFVCLALLVLRRRRPQADAFRLRAAPLWCGIGVAFLLAAGLRMDRGNWMAIGATTAVALGNWLWVRRRVSAVGVIRGLD
jgi:amino acid transporter